MKPVPQYPFIPLIRIGNLIVFVGAKTQCILFCQLKGVYRGISHLFLWDLKIKPSGIVKPKLKVSVQKWTQIHIYRSGFAKTKKNQF